MNKGFLIAILGIGAIYILTKKAGAEVLPATAEIPTTPVSQLPAATAVPVTTTQPATNLLPLVTTTTTEPAPPPAEFVPEPVYTPDVSLLYVVNPADILANNLPLTDPPTIVPYVYFTKSIYTIYPDILQIPNSVLEPDTLYIPGGNYAMSSNLQYFNDLRARQAEIAKSRKELEQTRMEAGISKTTNRPFYILKLVLDRSEYENLPAEASKSYVPIDTVNIPVGSMVLGDDIILPTGPSTYSEIYTIPPDASRQKYYRVFGQSRAYPAESQIALVRLADNNIIEFDLTTIYLEYQQYGRLDLYVKAVPKFLETISKLRLGELTTFTQAPMWDTRYWAGRVLQAPPMIMFLYVIKSAMDSKPFDPRY